MNSAEMGAINGEVSNSIHSVHADGQQVCQESMLAGNRLCVSVGDNLRVAYGGVLAQRETSWIEERQNGNYTLIFVNHGTLHIQVENEQFVVGKGQSFLLWPDETFGGCGPNATDLLCQWLNFEVHRAHHRARVGCVRVPRLGVFSDSGRATELFRFLSEDARCGNNSRQSTQFLLFSLLSELSNSEPVKQPVRSALAVLAERAQDYVRCNCGDPISSADIAKALDCSTGYLRKAFSVTYGYSPSDFLLRMRLHNARELLINSRLPVGQIASRCGFVSQSYFTRVFRREQGMTPGEFRVLHGLSYVVPSL